MGVDQDLHCPRASRLLESILSIEAKDPPCHFLEQVHPTLFWLDQTRDRQVRMTASAFAPGTVPAENQVVVIPSRAREHQESGITTFSRRMPNQALVSFVRREVLVQAREDSLARRPSDQPISPPRSRSMPVTRSSNARFLSSSS